MMLKDDEMMTVATPELLDPAQLVQVKAWMQQRNPKAYYTATAGNGCIWVYWGSMNLYFIFRDGKIADVQVD